MLVDSVGDGMAMSTADQSPPEAPEGARSRLGRFLPLLILAAGLAAFFALGLQHQVTLDALKAHRAWLLDYVHANPLVAAAGFAGIYATAVACSIPIGTLLTLAGGFLFGTLEGGALVVVSATLGASIIFLAAKTALAHFLEARLGKSLGQMEAGFRKNAFNYLLVLRLVPLFPFFLVNIGAGLLGVRMRTFFAATFIGIIPGTFVYAWLGSGLGRLFDRGVNPDLRIILRPDILGPLIGLALLALLPVVWRMFAQRRRA